MAFYLEGLYCPWPSVRGASKVNCSSSSYPDGANPKLAGLSWSGASAEITSLFRIECAGTIDFHVLLGFRDIMGF